MTTLRLVICGYALSGMQPDGTPTPTYIERKCVLLWEDIARMEGPPQNENGRVVRFFTETDQPVSAIHLKNGTILFTTANYDELSKKFVDYRKSIAYQIPGLFGN